MSDPTNKQANENRAATPAMDFGAIFRRLGPAGPLAVIATSLPAVGGWLLLGSTVWVAPWLKAQGLAGILIYIGAFAVLSGLAVLPTYAQAVVGGWAFGPVVGAFAAVSGFTGGSVIGYVVARRAAGDRVVHLIAEHPKWQAVYEALLGSGFLKSLGMVTLLRVPPNSPFAITNLVLAATRVSPVVFVLGTLFGMIPRTVAFAYIGHTTSEVSKVGGRPLWLTVAGIVLMLVVLGVVGSIANRAISRIAKTSS